MDTKTCEWKVPGRSIYCCNFKDWVHEIVYCYFVLKFFRTEMNNFVVAGYNKQFPEDLFGNKLFDSQTSE
jgi:hypothetical protein